VAGQRPNYRKDSKSLALSSHKQILSVEYEANVGLTMR